MIPTGYVECIVLRSNCKFYDNTRYFYPLKGDIIILPEYIAYVEELGRNIDMVEDEVEDEVT